jgi:hypothetical protein
MLYWLVFFGELSGVLTIEKHSSLSTKILSFIPSNMEQNPAAVVEPQTLKNVP